MITPLIVKVLAVSLTVSQLLTKPPEQFKSRFNPQADQQEVQALLNEGCAFMMKEFQAEKLDFDFLFTMMMGNAESQLEKAKSARQEAEALAAASGVPAQKSFTDQLAEQVDLPSVYAAYKTFCKSEKVENSPVRLEEVIGYYNGAIGELPDHSVLKGKKLPESSILLDHKDQKFTEVYSDDNRRRWISIKELPEHVKQAFVAAEDKRFFTHTGVDLRGIVRAFANNSNGDGRPQGGSTITQQVVKNLLVGDDLTFERKIREMILAVRVEKLLSKEEILELYLNYVFLGRASWGIEMASQSYFGKSAKQLSHAEAALLAGLTKGPNYYHPLRQPERAKSRRTYVLQRMKDDKYITDEQYKAAVDSPMTMIPYDPPRTKGGFFFIDEINRQVKKVANIPSLTSASYTVYSTLHSEMQKATDRALQECLFSYETQSGRVEFAGPEGSLAEDIEKYNKTWQETLPTTRPRLFDVQWPLAVVVEPPTRVTVNKNGKAQVVAQKVKVGLADGRVMPLVAGKGLSSAINTLKKYDLVHVQVDESGESPKAELRTRTTVQGAVLVMENRTGKVLAMSGGFSYAQTQLNRVTQSSRQTGSTLKPFIYLAALNDGYQPNTLIPDRAVTFPPINKGGRSWSPSNYNGGSQGLVTIRQAIEQSLNRPTARIMGALGPPGNPAAGLDYIQGITKELGIYKETERYYPFILGAQPARLIDMAVAYATIANDGLKPTPQFIDKLVKDGQVVYERPRFNLNPMRSVDRVAFYQLRRILEGTVVRGTASRIKRWAGEVAGKTGTSNNENDAWFIGFSKDITVAVWVGYDSRNIRPSLGSGFTGGRVALPIAEQVFESSFNLVSERQPLPPAPDEIVSQIYESPTTGRELKPGGIDVYRVTDGEIYDTKINLVSDDELRTMREPEGFEESPDDQIYQMAENEYRDPWEDFFAPEDRYHPGAEEPHDLSRRRERRVEPFFAQPIIFAPGGN